MTGVKGPRRAGAGLAAVLFDMDGTLLDSEKVWDVALDDTAHWLGGELSAAGRQAIVGSSVERGVELLHSDLGIQADPEASADYLLARTAELFQTELTFKPGAEQLLKLVAAAGVPAAMVTSTHRRLTEIALDVIGRQHFQATVCGNEVGRPKPHPEPYLLAAQLLGVRPADCLAIEDSPVGIAAAEQAGCAVLAVPSEVPIEPGPLRTVRSTLAGLGINDLQQILDDRQQLR